MSENTNVSTELCEKSSELDEKIVPYHTLELLNEMQKRSIMNTFIYAINGMRSISNGKILRLIKNLYIVCRLHYLSIENKKKCNLHPQKFHPMQPKYGEIYNAIITENVGSELSNNHLVIIISNEKTNLFAEKVNAVPIEGDGNAVPKYLVKLENSDLEYGKLDKSPSRIIIPEIITIDKARLGLKVGQIKNEKIIEIQRKILEQFSINIRQLVVDK